MPHSPLPFLISNSFPFSLIRHPVDVRPRSLDDLRTALATRPWKSAWGHSNTLSIAISLLGTDLRPETERPALALNPLLEPCLDGIAFRECWLLNPSYAHGFRPQPGIEPTPENIASWHVLQLLWVPA
jgi:hypothetical protein